MGKEKKDAEGKEVGKATHFYDNISVAVIELSGTLKVGDTIAVRGHTTNFEQPVEQMQIEHKEVKSAKKGKSIGLKVQELVREHDTVYKL